MSQIERALVIISYLVNLVVVGGWFISIQKKVKNKNFITNFFGAGDIKIYLPERYADSLKRQTVTNEDFHASVRLAEFLHKYHLTTSFLHISESDQINITSNCIFICGPKSNSFIHQILSYDPNFTFKKEDDLWYLYDTRNSYQLYSPIDKKPSINSDLAYVNKFKRGPFHVLIIAGIHSIGSLGAINLLTNEKKLIELVDQVQKGNFSTVLISKFDKERKVIESSSIFIPPSNY